MCSRNSRTMRNCVPFIDNQHPVHSRLCSLRESKASKARTVYFGLLAHARVWCPSRVFKRVRHIEWAVFAPPFPRPFPCGRALCLFCEVSSGAPTQKPPSCASCFRPCALFLTTCAIENTYGGLRSGGRGKGRLRAWNAEQKRVFFLVKFFSSFLLRVQHRAATRETGSSMGASP